MESDTATKELVSALKHLTHREALLKKRVHFSPRVETKNEKDIRQQHELRATNPVWTIIGSLLRKVVPCVGGVCGANSHELDKSIREYFREKGQFGTSETFKKPTPDPETLSGDELLKLLHKEANEHRIKRNSRRYKPPSIRERSRPEIIEMIGHSGPRELHPSSVKPTPVALEEEEGNSVYGHEYVPPASGGTRKRKRKYKYNHKRHHCSKKCFRHTGK